MGTVDHPFFGGTDRDRQPRVACRRQESGTKDTGQGEFVKQVLPLDLFPLSPALIDTAAGHNDMHMRMIIKASGLSMQYGRHPHIRT